LVGKLSRHPGDMCRGVSNSMATKRMLVDASHPEETRVVVVSGNRVEDIDVEVESRRQLKGNIYLAKVTRVEPSLQAAFVDYGGNRHGFLAFSEIHPDYYQIPIADREALLAEEQSAQIADSDDDDVATDDGEEPNVEELGGSEDEIEEAEEARRPVVSRRNYKIQEVIKRRQILLVQVVKEERGNKGAALTTYLSLAGRYCVLMPNTARGGGISRKIASGQDRKRLKTILADLGIPAGMAVIVRTAGSKRTKAEIKRDYEYLIRLWEQIRQHTLESIAPSRIHEEGDLIKRSIRDVYTKDIEEVVVHGEEAYRAAKDFMKLMMPSHAKRVQPYKDTSMPLLQRFQVEGQIDSMHMPEVHLKSGGYIVINSTEALVAIDVNSGKATRERNIEETALKTNIEAAEEIARQLRLRDLAGLIVIDFIDMEVHRNNSKVERVLKDAMRSDRARIQIGRISPFGLLEMSRQRLRPSLLEMHSEPCPHCSGTGIRRSSDTSALHVLRAIEEEATRRRNSEITVHVSSEIALYILNQKRDQLTRIETDYQLRVFIESDDSLIPPDHRMDRVRSDGNTVEESNDEEDTTNAEEPGRKRRRRRGRRRGKRDDEQNENVEANEASEAEEDEENREASDPEADGDDENAKPSRRRRRGRRAGRKRGRKSEEENAVAAEGNEESSDDSETPSEAKTEPTEKDTAVEADADAEKKPQRRPRRRKPAAEKTEAKAETKTETETNEGSADDASSSDESASTEPSPLIEVKVEEPAPAPESEAENPVVSDTPAETARTTVIDVSSIAEEEKPTKRGWWRRG
jgi:ribonuclease E